MSQSTLICSIGPPTPMWRVTVPRVPGGMGSGSSSPMATSSIRVPGGMPPSSCLTPMP